MAGWNVQRRGYGSRLMTMATILSLSSWHPGLRAAGELEGSLSAGYDSNPAQSASSGPSLAFAHYTLAARQRAHNDDGELLLSLDGWYRDYEGDNDNHRVTAGGEWSASLDGGRGRLGIGADLSFYRDRLVPADERDEAALLLRYRRLLWARADLGVSGQFLRASYTNPSLPGAGRPGPGGAPLSFVTPASRRGPGGPGPGPGPGGPPPPPLAERDDTLAVLRTDLTYYWGPGLSTALHFNVGRSRSTLSPESYDRYGVGLSMDAEPAVGWRAGLLVDWDRLNYPEWLGGGERDDTLWRAEAFVSRDVGEGELFCRLRYVHNASTAQENAFEQTVSRCGIAWNF